MSTSHRPRTERGTDTEHRPSCETDVWVAAAGPKAAPDAAVRRPGRRGTLPEWKEDAHGCIG